MIPRRTFLRSTTALLATTMLCPVRTLSHNAMMVATQRAQMQMLANYWARGLQTPAVKWFTLGDA